LNPVRKLRLELNLTRAQLAVAAGVNYADVRAAEVGLVQTPHRRIVALAERFGIPASAFIAEHRTYMRSLGASIVDARQVGNAE
jgi:transcriptional regulator with XRE-family HTH domain